MVLAIVGSRDFNDYEFLRDIIDKINIKDPITEIVSGGANGADSLGARYAKENNIKLKIFYPEWDKYGKSAGYKRNIKIVEYCEVIVAFWDGQSKGTKHSIDLANKLKKPGIIIDINCSKEYRKIESQTVN